MFLCPQCNGLEKAFRVWSVGYNFTLIKSMVTCTSFVTIDPSEFSDKQWTAFSYSCTQLTYWRKIAKKRLFSMKNRTFVKKIKKKNPRMIVKNIHQWPPVLTFKPRLFPFQALFDSGIRPSSKVKVWIIFFKNLHRTVTVFCKSKPNFCKLYSSSLVVMLCLCYAMLEEKK